MFNKSFYGSASVGEKGQIVIPVNARNALNLEIGDKLLVFSGPGNKGLVLVKPEVMEDFVKKMNEDFTQIKLEDK